MLGAWAAAVPFYPLSSWGMFFSPIACHQGADTGIRDGFVGIMLQFLFSVRMFPCPCRCFPFLPWQEYMKPFCCDIYWALGLRKLLMSVSVWKSITEEPPQCSHCSPLLTAGPAFLLEIVLITYDSNLQDSVTHWCFSVEIILIPGPSDLPWLH